MKVLVALCFVAAVAQAIDLNTLDWASVRSMDIYPKNIDDIMKLNEGYQASLASRITGGEEASFGQFPYQVALFASVPGGTGFCGGSILNEKWILTAAHCVDVADEVTVLFGAHNIVDRNEEIVVQIASKIIWHENWDAAIVRNDIALLEVPEPIQFNALVQPTRLPSRSQASTTFAGQTGVVSGWGRDSDSATGVTAILRWTSNPILTQLRCNLRWFGVITSDQVCLSGDSGRSSCNGDSGGPLVVTDSDGEVTQIGVVSFGSFLGCAVGWPSVYVRTSAYLDWIETNTGGSYKARD